PQNVLGTVKIIKRTSPSPRPSPIRWERLASGRMRVAQLHNRRAPAAELWMVQRKRDNVRVFRQDGVHRAPQVADAFAVNDAHLQDASFLTCGQIIRD